MKIALMTRWNVPSGQSSHAEPVGRAWREMGHDVKVLAPAGMDLTLLYQEDEPFVRRCYMMDVWGERARGDYFFDRGPLTEEDYDIFLVEDAEIMPMPELLEVFPRIRRKAATALVVHEVGLPRNPDWYKFDWDAVVCFDERYKEFLVRAFPEERVSIIPFPCHPVAHGDKGAARKRLGLPPDKKIVFAYGYDTVFYHLDLVPVLERLCRDYPVLFLLLTHHNTHRSAGIASVPEFIQVRDELPPIEKLYAYLHACDAYVNYGRDRIDGVGVSSSAAACFGAGRPVLVPGYCNFFDLSGKEVVKYRDLRDMERILRDVFDETPEIRESLAAAERYAARNSSYELASRFLELFAALRGEAVSPGLARHSERRVSNGVRPHANQAV